MPTDVTTAPPTRLSSQYSPHETSGGRRFASLESAAHGSGSGLAGKSTQSPAVSPEWVGSDSTRYPDIVRLRQGVLTERFSHSSNSYCWRPPQVTERFGHLFS